MKHYITKSFSVCLVIVLLITSLTGCGEYKKNIVGKWTYEISVRDQVIHGINEWMDDAVFAERVDVYELVPQLNITVELTFDENGNWNQSINEASYKNCESLAMQSFRSAFMELLLIRAVNAGNLDHEDNIGITHEENLANAEALFIRAVGMSFEDYAKANCEPLLADYNTLNYEYSASGTYKIDEKGLHRNVSVQSGASVSLELNEEYLLNDDMLVFTECVSEQNMGTSYPCSYMKVVQ